MEQLNFPLVIKTLKLILKSRKITYQQIARKTGGSESGIKKIFSGSDCSLKKLLLICDAADISFADLIATCNHSRSFETVEVPQEQQTFFLENPDYFHFYWRLAIEELDLAEIAARYKLSPKQQFRYLKKLDDFNLIELHAGNKIKLPRKALTSWGKNGPLMSYIMTQWPKRAIDRMVRNIEKSDRFYSIRYIRLTKESYQELLQAQRSMIRDFSERSSRDSLINDRKKLLDVSMVMLSSPTSFLDELPLQEI